MTREEAKRNIEVITAFGEGQSILTRSKPDGTWAYVEDLIIDSGNDYLINDEWVEYRKAEALGKVIELECDAGWKRKPFDGFCIGFTYRVKKDWIPEAGEMIRVSAEASPKTYLVKEFICMTKDGSLYVTHYDSGCNVGVWKYAKPLNEED